MYVIGSMGERTLSDFLRFGIFFSSFSSIFGSFGALFEFFSDFSSTPSSCGVVAGAGRVLVGLRMVVTATFRAKLRRRRVPA